jgi:hypothetical protein
MSRIHSRKANGCFRRATLANTFGLSVEVCPSCRICNPHGVNEPKPEKCHSCGADLRSEADELDREDEDREPEERDSRYEREQRELDETVRERYR